MRVSIFSVALITALSVSQLTITIPALHAQELSSSLQFKVKKVGQNIERLRSKLASQGAAAVADDFKAKQLKGQIDSYRAGLAKMPSKDDVELLKAQASLAALTEEFNALVSGGAAPKAAAAPAQETPSTGSASTTATAAPAPKADPNVRPLVSGERVRVKKMTRDLKGVREGVLTNEGPSHFQDKTVIAKYKKRLDQFAEALKKYPQLDDPDVIAARNEYAAFRKDLSTEFNLAKEQLNKVGDAQARIAQIDQRIKDYPVPNSLSIPFSEKEINAWLKAASAVRTVAEHDRKQIVEIAGLAYLPDAAGTPETGAPYDTGDLQRMFDWHQTRVDKINIAATNMNEELKRAEEHIRKNTLTRWQDDPDSDKRWLFLKEDQVQQAKTAHEEGLGVASSALAFSTAFKQDTAKAVALKADIEAAQKDFAAKRKIALNTSRLPEPKTDNAEMLAFAKEILARPRYEFGEHGPIVLTTKDITDHEKKESEAKFTDVDVSLSGDITLKGTETTWTYRWKEFKFATPLKNEDGSWSIWWVTARKYSSGSSITPIGEWVAGRSTEGNLILAENF